jgi:hypothetical protein
LLHVISKVISYGSWVIGFSYYLSPITSYQLRYCAIIVM